MRENDFLFTTIEAERQPLRPQLVNSPVLRRQPRNRKIAEILAVIMIFVGAAVVIGSMLLLLVDYWPNFPHSP